MRRLGLVFLALLAPLALAAGSPAATQTYTSHQLHAADPGRRHARPHPAGARRRPRVLPRRRCPHRAPARRRPDAHARQPGRPQGRPQPARGRRRRELRLRREGLRRQSGLVRVRRSRRGRPRRRLLSPASSDPSSRSRRSTEATRAGAGRSGSTTERPAPPARSCAGSSSWPGTSSRTSGSPAAASPPTSPSARRTGATAISAITVRRDGRRVLKTSVARLSCKDCLVAGLDTITEPAAAHDPRPRRGRRARGAPRSLHGRSALLLLHGDPALRRSLVPRQSGLLGRPRLRPARLRPRRPARVRHSRRPLRLRVHVLRRVVPARPGARLRPRRRVRRHVRASPRSSAPTPRTSGTSTSKDRANRQDDLRGLLAAWVADEYRLGLADEAWKQIEVAYRRGELSAPRVDPLWPAGRKYISHLRAFLVKTGYAPS